MTTQADPSPAQRAEYDLERLYRSEQLRGLIKRVRKNRRLSRPDFSVTRRSPVCGSEVTIEGTVDSRGVIDRIGYRTRACSLAMASTGVLVQRAPGVAPEEILRARHALRRILSGQDASATAFPVWPELQCFSAAEQLPARHASILLSFDALVEGFCTSSHDEPFTSPRVQQL